MASRLIDTLREGNSDNRVTARIENYEHRYGGTMRGGRDERKAKYQEFENTYYDLVTDFFEYG